jgi:membrane-bound inhibitor of C-type lysozyme
MTKRWPGALLTITVLGALSGCATPRPTSELRVVYACDRGADLVIVYVDGVARIETGDGPPLILPQQRSGSGFAYGNATHTLRGKGEDLTYTIGRMVPLQCRAK